MGFAPDHLDNEVMGTTRYWSKSGGPHPTKRATALKQVLGYPTALAVLEPVTIDSTYTSDFNEAAQDAVGNALVDGTTIDFTYSDAGNTITAEVKLNSLDNTYMVNRIRVWPIDLAAGFQTAGTGTKLSSSGLAINMVDGETGTWRWTVPIPGDLVTGAIATYIQWDTTVTTGNVLWVVSVGSTSAGAVHSPTNINNAVSSTVAVAGTTNVQTQTVTPSTNNVTAGRGDIAVVITRVGGDATDTANANVLLRAVWIEYTADM